MQFVLTISSEQLARFGCTQVLQLFCFPLKNFNIFQQIPFSGSTICKWRLKLSSHENLHYSCKAPTHLSSQWGQRELIVFSSRGGWKMEFPFCGSFQHFKFLFSTEQGQKINRKKILTFHFGNTEMILSTHFSFDNVKHIIEY